jgi:hypothetical protein
MRLLSPALAAALFALGAPALAEGFFGAMFRTIGETLSDPEYQKKLSCSLDPKSCMTPFERNQVERQERLDHQADLDRIINSYDMPSYNTMSTDCFDNGYGTVSCHSTW